MEIHFSDGTGRVERYADWAAPGVLPRHVDVWCPPGYAEHPQRRYPVIYMHDGQNLFDPASAFIGVDWGVDEAIAQLVYAGESAGAIVVGLWNTAQRRSDYMPQKFLEVPEHAAYREMFYDIHHVDAHADAYLALIAQQVKPFIDAKYRTKADRANTFVMGSSMGGLISLYALVEYPEIFGGAGCVSTHWSIAGDALVDWFGSRLPRAGQHRLYFDYGTETVDAPYEPLQLRFDGHLAAAGFQSGEDWLTRKFPGADHSERAWRSRLQIPLRFLLGI